MTQNGSGSIASRISRPVRSWIAANSRAQASRLAIDSGSNADRVAAALKPSGSVEMLPSPPSGRSVASSRPQASV
jgi:hypothetical protein